MQGGLSYSKGVCLSVRLSVTRVNCDKTVGLPVQGGLILDGVLPARCVLDVDQRTRSRLTDARQRAACLCRYLSGQHVIVNSCHLPLDASSLLTQSVVLYASSLLSYCYTIS